MICVYNELTTPAEMFNIFNLLFTCICTLHVHVRE